MRLLACTCICLGTAVLQAQETTGDVRGRIHSDLSVPVSDAVITASRADFPALHVVRSAKDGVFLLYSLSPGVYSLRVTAIGYGAVTMDSVRVQLGRTTNVEFGLRPVAASLAEVRVVAPRLSLDPSRSTIGGTIEAVDLAALPAERDYKSTIAILPHINTSFRGDPVNSAGSTGLENMYFVDGVNATAPLTAGSGTSLPHNFIREIEVRSGGYEAQYGRALGAIVNAITYSGSNRFESTAFGYFTGDGLTAAPRLLPFLRETGAKSYDVGIRVSGPVIRNRLWYSAAVNPRVTRVSRSIAQHGEFLDRESAMIVAGKLTWLVSVSTSVELSAFGDPTKHQAVDVDPALGPLTPLNADPYLITRHTGGILGALRGRTQVGDRVTIESAVSYSSGRDEVLGSTAIARSTPPFVDVLENELSGGSITPIRDRSRVGRAAASLRATMIAGNHTAVSGIEYEDAATDWSWSRPGGYWLLRFDPEFFVTIAERARGRFHNRGPTAYLQDSWRLSDALTVNVGLRWARQDLLGARNTLVQRLDNEWQPRLGFVWQPSSESDHRVFGSFGRFYQQLPLHLTTSFVDFEEIRTRYATDPRQPGATPIAVIEASSYLADRPRQVPDVQAEHVDEVTLGYEQRLGSAMRLGIRLLTRALRSSFQTGIDSSGGYLLGTPGQNEFAFLTQPRRQYAALELTLEHASPGARLRGSYVLSRNRGNYTGLFDSDLGFELPGTVSMYSAPGQQNNSFGLLPNDRTHVLKVAASGPVPGGVEAGVVLSWSSGSPLNIIGGSAYMVPVFLVPRGSAERTPSLWDANVRVSRVVRSIGTSTARLVVDLLHVGNPRRAVRVDEQKFYGVDESGMQINPNPNYGRDVAFQPPMMARIGIEIMR